MDFLDSLLNNIDEAVIITDPTGRILLFNEPALIQNNMLEATKPLKEGEYLINVSNPKRRKVISGIIKELNTKKQNEKSFVEYRNRQGATVYLDHNFVPVLNTENELSHIYLFVRDITPQKVYEKKLTTQATNMHTLIEQANAVIISVDTLGYITDWNTHSSVITGFQKDDVFARKISEILIIDHIDMKQGMDGIREIMIRTKNGEPKSLLLSQTPNKTGNGDVIGYTFVGQDVTELTGYRKSLEKKIAERTQQAQEALANERKAVEAKGRFVSMTSHELRTPLSTIQFATNYIRRNHAKISDDDLKGRLETIDRQVSNMTQLLEDVLAYSRAESGASTLQPGPIALKDFLNNSVEEVGHHNGNSHLVIKDFRHLPDVFKQDEKLLRNIIINLLNNAIKYSPGKDSVEMVVRKVHNDLIITVRDQGIGIEHNDQTKIFDPFVRSDQVSHIQGTGLGLSIVKKSLDLMKGSITVDSQPGFGSAFTVIIPEYQ